MSNGAEKTYFYEKTYSAPYLIEVDLSTITNPNHTSVQEDFSSILDGGGRGSVEYYRKAHTQFSDVSFSSTGQSSTTSQTYDGVLRYEIDSVWHQSTVNNSDGQLKHSGSMFINEYDQYSDGDLLFSETTIHIENSNNNVTNEIIHEMGSEGNQVYHYQSKNDYFLV